MKCNCFYFNTKLLAIPSLTSQILLSFLGLFAVDVMLINSLQRSDVTCLFLTCLIVNLVLRIYIQLGFNFASAHNFVFYAPFALYLSNDDTGKMHIALFEV